MLSSDIYPTHEFKGHRLRAGKPLPFGATPVRGGVNFSVYSLYATECILVLYKKSEKHPFAEIPFFEEFKVGNVFTMIVFDIEDYEEIEYGFRMDGPFDPAEGHWFDKSKILMDPYSKVIGGRDVWGEEPDFDAEYSHRSRIAVDDFDWKDDRQLTIPMEDLIIYEMHVRGFTAHPSSGVKNRGTFDGLREKIPYLKELGVNAVELLPVHEFDEFQNTNINPESGSRLYNYWGYSNVGFFAPKAGFAAMGKYGMQVDEFKSLIYDLHQNGIEVILDVVFNHTAEGSEDGPYISYRGIDNKTYYMLTPDGHYYNFSGCGNTLNCNNPIVRNMILDCLRYWATEYHIDGFRFDLASILGRDQDGAPLHNPPLLETLAFDPILAHCKLIAEAWDAGGLYQVGSFPNWGRWAEWNGKFRDDIRRFLKSDAGMVGKVASRVIGSPDLYQWQQRGSNASINFITAHDGFPLWDLYSYNEKHNEANGEGNRDGSGDNFSWNCGVEGETKSPTVLKLRKRLVKNAAAVLMVSQGIPMFLAGDEIGNSQFGNNNVYCQDNEISWLNWEDLDKNYEFFRFFRNMIEFRKAHPILRMYDHLQAEDHRGLGSADISWHGLRPNEPDWSEESRQLAFMLNGQYAESPGGCRDDFIYVAMNSHWEKAEFELPALPAGMKWHVFCNTGQNYPDEITSAGAEIPIRGKKIKLIGRSLSILVGKYPKSS